MAGPEGRRDVRPRGARGLLLVLCVAASLQVAALVRRPDLVGRSDACLTGDLSVNFLVAERLLAGDALYSDVAYHYGPLSAYAYAALAALTWNGLLPYLGLVAAVGLVHVALLWVLLRRETSSATATGVTLALLPAVLAPGSLLAGQTFSPYVSIERCLVVACALLWRPSSLARAVALGVVLGAWQWTKFGGAALAGASVVVLDLSARVRRPIRGYLATGAAFLAVEAARIAWAYARLPAEVARDVVCPSYHLATYASYVHGWLPFLPRYHGAAYLVGQQLTPLVALVLGAASAATRLCARTPSPLLLPLVFFALGCASGYLRHVHHFHVHVWCAGVAAALVVERLGRRHLVVLALLAIPCFAASARAMVVSRPAPALVRVELPTGESIVAPPACAERLARLERALEELRAGRSTGACFVRLGAGLHPFYRIPHVMRPVWFIPGFVRPHDEPDVLRALDRLHAFVFLAHEGEAPDPRLLAPVLPEETLARLTARLGAPVSLDARCAVYPVTAPVTSR